MWSLFYILACQSGGYFILTVHNFWLIFQMLHSQMLSKASVPARTDLGDFWNMTEMEQHALMSPSTQSMKGLQTICANMIQKDKNKNTNFIFQHNLHQIQDSFVSNNNRGHPIHVWETAGPGDLTMTGWSLTLLSEEKWMWFTFTWNYATKMSQREPYEDCEVDV